MDKPHLKPENSALLTPSLGGCKPKIFSATPMLAPNQSTNRHLLKSDLDSLETIKSMCTDAFSVMSQVDAASFEQQFKFYEHRLKALTVLVKNPSFSQKTADVTTECLTIFRKKATDLSELIQIERELWRTLPGTAQK